MRCPAIRSCSRISRAGTSRSRTPTGSPTILASLVELAVAKSERVALLHRLGQVLEGPLADPERAIERYQEALALEPTSIPVLQALGRLLSSRTKWPELVGMHLGEAGGDRGRRTRGGGTCTRRGDLRGPAARSGRGGDASRARTDARAGLRDVVQGADAALRAARSPPRAGRAPRARDHGDRS